MTYVKKHFIRVSKHVSLKVVIEDIIFYFLPLETGSPFYEIIRAPKAVPLFLSYIMTLSFSPA